VVDRNGLRRFSAAEHLRIGAHFNRGWDAAAAERRLTTKDTRGLKGVGGIVQRYRTQIRLGAVPCQSRPLAPGRNGPISRTDCGPEIKKA
jgi:hypothetical protein